MMMMMIGVIIFFSLHILVVQAFLQYHGSFSPSKISSCLCERKAPATNDFISRLFSPFMPTPEDIGLTRFNRTSRPENYYATTDEWVEALSFDEDPDVALIRQTLKYTNLEKRPLQLAYCANTHGWNAKDFHKRVDKLGPAVVLARSVSGGVFGGYNPTGWVNYGEYRGSIAAFLFTFPNGDLNNRPIKLPKISGAGLAQIDDGNGPKFGPEGLTIALERGNPKLVRSKLGLYYDRLPGGGKSLLPKGAAFDELVDLKVYLGVYEAGEKIPYNDALPFSLN